MHFWRFTSRFLKVFYVLKESSNSFYKLMYVIFTFGLLITENSCPRSVNAMYGVFFVFFITALKS